MDTNIVDEYIKDKYIESISIIGNIEHLFLESIKVNLKMLNIYDITNVQAIIVYNIGVQIVGIGDIRKLGYYKGMNVSYNLNSLVKNNYLDQFPNVYDGRCKRVRLSPKGLELHASLNELFTKHARTFANEGHSIADTLEALKCVENFWKNLIRGGANA